LIAEDMDNPNDKKVKEAIKVGDLKMDGPVVLTRREKWVIPRSLDIAHSIYITLGILSPEEFESAQN
jgi:hypothetical protein